MTVPQERYVARNLNGAAPLEDVEFEFEYAEDLEIGEEIRRAATAHLPCRTTADSVYWCCCCAAIHGDGDCGMCDEDGEASAEEEAPVLPRLCEWCSARLVAGVGLLCAEIEYGAALLVVRVRAEGAGIDGARDGGGSPHCG
jgi:hypothetical protein